MTFFTFWVLAIVTYPVRWKNGVVTFSTMLHVQVLVYLWWCPARHTVITWSPYMHLSLALDTLFFCIRKIRLASETTGTRQHVQFFFILQFEQCLYIKFVCHPRILYEGCLWPFVVTRCAIEEPQVAFILQLSSSGTAIALYEGFWIIFPGHLHLATECCTPQSCEAGIA